MKQKLLIISLMASWSVMASSNIAVLQSNADEVINKANKNSQQQTSSALNLVEQHKYNDGEKDELKLDESTLSDAQKMIDIATERMNATSVQREAKDLVTQAETFAGSSVFESNPSASVLTNGIDIGALIAQYKNPYQEKADPTGGKKLSTLMVFVSSSMPESMLIEMATQTQKAGGHMMLNGFIGGKLSSTISFMMNVFQETGVIIDIDPNMFELFKVTSVPQIIVTSEPLKPCSPDQAECEYVLPTHDRMRGNVTLYYALEQFSWNGQASATALEHLGQLQSEQWNK
ncbi:type-F conjugative transfer system pilin assembly protein TrbC [Vibrio vulnificus]|uniref:type-F conjugative transfer system pilin assembly protein TrbC n=1 Tax=Vibrio vulnificus TaxID=672 RepID=UPI0010232E08|nr:type-F conjugative transfer system pilin assembly protein TrbC [Vibrio vulnificus]RZQ33252.1 type-F conjugative transfer system pilin assembly protein TrbC [Vibrio vulnificus]